MKCRNIGTAVLLTITLLSRHATGRPAEMVSRLVNEQKRQHWTASLSPGGKRSFDSNGNQFMITAKDEDEGEAPSMLDDQETMRYLVSRPTYDEESEETLDQAKRQHWTTGLSPGGKRQFNEYKRQHWTTGLSPGGKRQFNEYKRQHWTTGLSPGGKRGFPPEDKQEYDQMPRQHWTSGLKPGGGRSHYEKKNSANPLRETNKYFDELQMLRMPEAHATGEDKNLGEKILDDLIYDILDDSRNEIVPEMVNEERHESDGRNEGDASEEELWKMSDIIPRVRESSEDSYSLDNSRKSKLLMEN